MNRFLIGLIILLTIITCNSNNEIILSKYENGQIKELLILNRPVTNDSLGFKKIFRKNGDLQCEGGYNRGLRHGQWVGFYDNDSLEWRSEYFLGKENGETYCKYKDGSWKKLNSIDGKRNGPTVEYYRNSKGEFFYIYGQYENDLKTGLWVKKNKEGQKIEEFNYDKGVISGQFAYYYPNGNLKMKGTSIGNEDNAIIATDTLFYYAEIENGKVDSIVLLP